MTCVHLPAVSFEIRAGQIPNLPHPMSISHPHPRDIPDAQEPDESPESDYPQGITWYAATWEDAAWWLPRGSMMPVQVWLRDGSMPIWLSIGRDWRPVLRWRRVHVTSGCARRLRREQSVVMLEQADA